MRRGRTAAVGGAAACFLALAIAPWGATPRAPVPAAAASARVPIRPKPGTLSGRVTLKGERPDVSAKTAALRAAMKAKDEEHCLKTAPPDQTVDQSVRVGRNKGVGNAVVFLRPPDGQFFEIDPAKLDKALLADVVLDQPHCAFVPHVLALFPMYHDSASPRQMRETGQKLVVKNSANTAHCTKLGGGVRNRERNQTLAPKESITFVLNPSPEPVQIGCHIHPWMSGYAWVFDHPYAAVTRAPADEADKSYGAYEIRGVPTDMRGVRVVLWHEVAGFVPDAEGVEIDLSLETRKDFKISLTPR
jgi:hypothetical protein